MISRLPRYLQSPGAARRDRVLLALLTLAMLILCVWHLWRFSQVQAATALVYAGVSGLVAVTSLLTAIDLGREHRSALADVIRRQRRTGIESAYELSAAWKAQRLTMAEVELTGATLWAVDLNTETVISSHGRRGLAGWDLVPGETLGDPISHYDAALWSTVCPMVLADPSQSHVVVGDGFVSTYAASPVHEPSRIVVTTIRTDGALDLRTE